MKPSGVFEPACDEVVILLTAPTGVAAFNINGMTLPSAFQLGCSHSNKLQPLSSKATINTLPTKLSTLALLIIDEVSMVESNMLLSIRQ